MADDTKDEGLYVPVVNTNYIPKGAPDPLEGFVPNHPKDDQALTRMRADLYQQGLVDGGPDTPDVPEYEPNSEPPKDEPAPEETPIPFNAEATKPLAEENTSEPAPEKASQSSSEAVY